MPTPSGGGALIAQGTAPPPWNALAVVAFVLAFVVPPGAIACGHVALAQIRRTGEQGRGLALAGATIGSALTAFLVLFVVLWFGALAAVALTWLAIGVTAIR